LILPLELKDLFADISVPRTSLHSSDLFPSGNFFVERFDKTHPVLQGNKWFKLKRNVFKCLEEGNDTILTFGGAFSNHIHATAGAGNLLGLKTIGVIRGERANPLNYTLREAEQFGMHLHFVSRTEYRERYSDEYIRQLKAGFGDFYFVPEGGSNRLGFLGASEMLPADFAEFDYIIMAMGSGGTLGGNLIAANQLPGCRTKFLAVPVLKDYGYVLDNLKQMILQEGVNIINNLEVLDNFHFGGYAKTNEILLDFINNFQLTYNLELDPIYTGKVHYAVSQLSQKGFFNADDKILIYHTGGLQGKIGFVERLPKYRYLHNINRENSPS
jgi:1-aminocyclopropane-1-carboxylate deaminase